MKRFAPALLALLVLPLVTTARDDTLPDGWREVTGGYKNRAYVVWYPKGGKLTNDEDSIVSKDFGQIRIYRSVLQRKDGSLLATSQILLPPKLVKAPPKVRQDFFRDMFLKEFDGKLVEEKKTKLGTMAGREYLVKTSKGMARYVVLGTGVQIFRVAFVGTKDQLESKDTQTFASIRSSGRRKPPTRPPRMPTLLARKKTSRADGSGGVVRRPCPSGAGEVWFAMSGRQGVPVAPVRIITHAVSRAAAS